MKQYPGTPDNPEFILDRIVPKQVRFMREWALGYHEVPAQANDFFHIVRTTDVDSAATGIGQLWVNSASVGGPTTSVGTIND